MANTTTRQTIRNGTLAILNDTSTSQVFTTSVLNRLIEEIELEVAQMWKWQFLRAREQIIAPVFTTLEADLTTSDVTATVGETTNYDNTQAVYIMQNVIPYTGTTSTTLTGLTDIAVNHEAGQTVYPLLELPANYHKLISVYYGHTSTQYNRKFLYVLENDWWKQIPYVFPACTVINVETAAYLLCVGQAVGDTITVQYQKRPATYTNDTDVSSFPNEYIPYIEMMVAGQAKLRYDDNLDGMGDVLYNQAKEKIMHMTKLYGEREQGMSRLVKTSYRAAPESYNFGTGGFGFGNWNA